MLEVKHCHRTLRPRSRFLGLELLDLLVVVALGYPIGLASGFLSGVAVAVGMGVMLRLVSLGHLPHYTQDLVIYLCLLCHSPTLGPDRGPAYPLEGEGGG